MKGSKPQFRPNEIYVANNLVVSESLMGKVDLIYADILYDHVNFDEIDMLVGTLKLGGAIYIQTDYRSVGQVKNRLDMWCIEQPRRLWNKDTALRFMNWIIWPYNWGGRPKDAFGRKHDDILFYVREGKKHVFNVKDISIPKVVLMRSTKATQIPTDVWLDIGNFYTTSKERVKVNGKNVPWQKPENLLERIILASSKPGQLVYEPYLGTGTACAVAKRLGRQFIGCDLDASMVKLARERLHAITRRKTK